MKGYIYFIINQVNGKRYVGQTTNFSVRKSHHKRALEENRHHNIKLQNAWNKYGSENFIFQKITYEEITPEELSNKEIYYIKKYNSIDEGYNIMSGGGKGEGNNSRGKLSYEEYCFIYLGNKEFPGMTTRTAKFLKIDSSAVSSIVRERSYIWYLDRLKNEPEEKKQSIIKDFEEKLQIKEIKPWTIQKTLDEDTTLKILCFVSTYGRGAEKVCLDKFNLSKGFVFHFVTGNGRKNIKDNYKQLSEEQICQIGKQSYIEWGITKKLKEKYKNLRDKYPKYPL